MPQNKLEAIRSCLFGSIIYLYIDNFSYYHSLKSIYHTQTVVSLLHDLIIKLAFHVRFHPLQLNPHLVTSILRTRGLGLGLLWRMVDFNHQLVDQCSQKRSNTRSHYGHPPPATSGPAKIDSMFALRQSTMWGNKMGISRASGVKPLTWKHPPPNRQCRWTTEVQNLLPGWVHIRCLSPLRCQWPALLLPLRQAEDNEGWSCSCGPREPGRTAAERPCRSPGCHGSS